MPDEKKSAKNSDAPVGVERRRARLPQPDLTCYKKVDAYPGANYFFVGHSYDTALDSSSDAQVKTRVDGIGSLLSDATKLVPISSALANKQFQSVLTRFEHDLLRRLPESTIIGTAIDSQGKVIPKSFTIWREERRKRAD